MRIMATIAEYNPFHKGHLFHLIQSKEKSSCTHTMVLMSGDFVQRGTPAIADKWTRTKIALLNDVDLVCELPFYAACQSAEFFARGALAILNATQAVDFLSFGCEEKAIEKLYEVAYRMVDEPDSFKTLLQSRLKEGYSFAAARQYAVSKLYNPTIGEMLSRPNNILAIEYLKAMIRTNSLIKPLGIQRKGETYDANQWPPPSNYASATQIRKGLLDGFDVQPYLPYSLSHLENAIENATLGIAKFDLALTTRLLQTSAVELRRFPYVSEGIENRILKSLHHHQTLEDISKHAASKRMPESRIRRILTNFMLGMSRNLFNTAYSGEAQPYLRVLGFNKRGTEILNRIKNSSTIPRLTQLKKAKNILTENQYKLLEKDILASNLYHLYFNHEFVYNEDYYRSPILIKP